MEQSTWYVSFWVVVVFLVFLVVNFWAYRYYKLLGEYIRYKKAELRLKAEEVVKKKR